MRTQHHQSLQAAFIANVVVRDLHHCWPWVGSVNGSGYGQLGYKRRKYWAHQLAYRLFIGPITHRDVCHSCDNRACCNPCHLFNDTHSENMIDAQRKGRLKLAPHVIEGMKQAEVKREAKRIAKHERAARVAAGLERERDSMGRFGLGHVGSRERNAHGQFGSGPSTPRKRNARGHFI